MLTAIAAPASAVTAVTEAMPMYDCLHDSMHATDVETHARRAIYFVSPPLSLLPTALQSSHSVFFIIKGIA